MVIGFKENVFDFLSRAHMFVLCGGKFKWKNKKGDMGIEVVVRIGLFVLFIVVMFGLIAIFSGKGGRLWEAVQNVLRFGG